MTAYRMYHIDGGGRFSAADWIEADSDPAAIEAARLAGKSVAFELWDGRRLVARIDCLPPETGAQPG